MQAISPIKAEFLARQAARCSFLSWCELCGFKPAKHHRLVIAELEQLVVTLVEAVKKNDATQEEVPGLRLMVLMPPGAAKSTYISKLFPPWFLAQLSNLGILACSHSADLASDFGRAARNLVESNNRWLGYSLTKDSRAVDKWATTNGGYYQAAGVGAGIAGRRAHLGVIDDFCGSEEEAGSKLFNDKIWNWYENDFVQRLQPHAARVIIANHRNEDDLVGRLMQKEPTKWRIVKLRLLIETTEQAESDPLGRQVGEWLWPEYFTKALVDERMAMVGSSGIQQQEPSPEKGGFFQAEWLDNAAYDSLAEIPVEAQSYAASDHAVSEKQTADPTCMGIGKFVRGHLYIHPDIEWERINAKKAVDAFIRLMRLHKPLTWWAEKGHISKSIGPFLQDRMMDEHVFVNIVEVTPVKDKVTRAQSVQGMASMGLVHLPRFAPWFQRARKELLMFPNGKHDDFVDFLAHLGRGVNTMFSGRPARTEKKYDLNRPFSMTVKEMKDGGARKERLRFLALQDN